MPKAPFPLTASWGRMLVALATLVMTAPPAAAQFIAAMVNGEPVTNYDIEQRTKLVSIATQKNPTRKEVLEELIDEKLKTQLIRRYNIEGIDKDVDNALANMARRGRHTPKQ